MAELFDQCDTPADTWALFYQVACLVHPAQGGMKEDMEALCRAAKERLGEAYPFHGIPNLFDLFCKATDTPNPFGQSIEGGGPGGGSVPAAVPAWEPAGPCPVPRVGRLVLVRVPRD